VQATLDWFIVHGIFSVKKKSKKSSISVVRTHLFPIKVYLSQLDTQAHRVPSSPYSDHLQRQCRERLLDCLADLTQLSAVTKTAEKTQKITGAYLDGQLWVSRVVYIIQNLEQDSKNVELLSKFDQDNRKVLERACGTVAWLRNVRPRFRAPDIVL
jgi:DNA polymerase phi